MASNMSGIWAGDAAEVSDSSPRRQAIRVTIVDDSDDFVALMEDVLGARFAVTGVLPRTIDEVATTNPDLVFIDLFVRDDNVLGGWELINRATDHPQLRDVPIIVCTGAVGVDLARLTTVPGVHLLAKPFDLDVLESTMRRAMAARPA